jgi:hypothetical protein
MQGRGHAGAFRAPRCPPLLRRLLLAWGRRFGATLGPLTDGAVSGYAGPMAQLSVRLGTGEQYYIELKPEDGGPEAQLQKFLNKERPFRKDWLETTTGRYVRRSILVSVELLTLDPDDPRLTS